jgi:hypothetical protein
MVSPLDHPARIWCQPSLNVGKDPGFKKIGVFHPTQKNLVENTAIGFDTITFISNRQPLEQVDIREMSLCISGTICLFMQSGCLHIVHLVLLDVERSIQGGESNRFRRFYLGLPCLLATIFLDYYYYFGADRCSNFCNCAINN